MPVLKLVLDEETQHRLEEDADAERRPPQLQAEVIIRRALGLTFPYPKLEHDSSDPRVHDGGGHAAAS